MADFKTPNLCGANETLNGALSKIKNLKDEIIAQSTALPSVKKAAFESKLADVKAGLDALAIDLPEAKPVNFQSEITSLINDIDKTTAEGLAAFNLKVAELKKDFGGAISDKGLDFDNLISESTTKLGKDISTASTALSSVVTDATGAVTDIFNSVTDSVSGIASNISSGLGISGVPGNVTPSLDAFGGTGDAVAGVATPTTPTVGNICALVPNFELPASAAGTGVTTQEIEERVSNAATITLTQIPKEILEVTGNKTTQSFFTNIQYNQNGKTIVPKATGTYTTIKVKYTIDLIQEKPVAAKQADVPPEKEEVSIVTANTSAKDTSFAGLIAKFKKDVESAPSKNDVSKDLAGIKSAISFIGSPDYKAKQEKDFATWQTEYKKLKADPLNYKPVVTPKGETIKVTTPEATITKEIKTDISGATYTETKRVTSSDAGFTTRPKEKDVQLVRLDLAKEVLSEIDISTYQDTYELIQEVIDYFEPTTSLSSIEIPDPVWNLIEVSLMAKGNFNPVTREISPDGIVAYELTDFNNRGSELSTIYYQLNGQTITFNDIAGRPVDPFTERDIFATNITYITLDKIDPNYKG